MLFCLLVAAIGALTSQQCCQDQLIHMAAQPLQQQEQLQGQQ